MKREDTRNHILDTALDLFWQQSYHGVNMNALSRAAGLNKATV
ncbi:MAG TPA: TetR/AcrR family transcriptional regulator, partial [Rhodobacteraceae bacterium]|nr:TetR/AcrR family transcriptional regulator [Paracoccaceae bacterium]